MPEPHELTATQAARAIRARQLSALELGEAMLDRTRLLDHRFQAWERMDFDAVLAAARALDEGLKDGASLGAMYGVPFGVKDIFDTAGLRTAASFPPYEARVPRVDAEVVARLKASGGIMLGKTVATQFAFTDPARTRNPWSIWCTPGGSSSGSGAGVAAREMPLALGSQTAGSTLRPAAYCGVVGFKPTYGRVSLRGAFPLAWSLDHVGSIARSVEDCGLFLLAAEGAEASDIDDLPLPSPSRQGQGAPRLALLRDCLDFAATPLREHVLEVADRFRRAGALIHEARLGKPLDLIFAIHRVILTSEASAAYTPLLERYSWAFSPLLRATIQAGRLIPAPAYLQARRLRPAAAVALNVGLEGADALLLPTAADLPPEPETTGDPSLQIPATLGGFPAISLPSGVTTGRRVPLGIQLVGRHGRDEDLLNVAAWCEAQLPPMPPPPL